MSLTKLTENLNNVSSLPDKPTIQSDELKAVFDKASNTIKEYINEVLTEEIEKLVSDTAKSNKVKVENNLTSTSTVNALSSAQGTLLNNLIANLTAKDNTLTSQISNINTQINNLKTQDTNINTKITNLTNTVNGKQKNINKGTGTPSGGSNGDIYIQYF